MNNKPESTDMKSNLHADGYTIIAVGKPYPGKITNREGAQLAIGETLHLAITMAGPSAKEIKGFQSIKAYGFYKGADLPHGILLWDFGDAFACASETPFNPRLEETLRPDQMKAFLEGKTNACQRVLIDENGIVRALCLLGLDWELVDLLRKTWTDPDLDWSEYDGRYFDLIARKSTAELWKKAKKWTVSGVTAVQDQHDVHVCDNCKAVQRKVTSLKDDLKQQKATETTLHGKIAGLKDKISSLEQAKLALEDKLRSLSSESLQQDVAVKNVLLDEKGLEIEILKDDIEQGHRETAGLQSRISDLERHNAYLAGLLRKHGIGFNQVYGHGDRSVDEAA